MGTYEIPADLGRSMVAMRRAIEGLQRPKVLRPPHYTTATRPDPTTVTGGIIYNTTTGTVQFSNGVAWADL